MQGKVLLLHSDEFSGTSHYTVEAVENLISVKNRTLKVNYDPRRTVNVLTNYFLIRIKQVLATK
jgi:hypothetical protein